MTKKIISVFLSAVLMFCFAGCNAHIGAKTVDVKITEIHETYMIVADIDEDNKTNSERVYSIENSDFDSGTENFKTGDKLKITYKGNLLETYPLRFEEIISIEPFEEN